jgi:uncharacterized protein (DUF1015 family)
MAEAEIDALLDNHEIALIPHLTEPIPDDGRKPSEEDILIAGAYNLGFVALARRPEVDALLNRAASGTPAFDVTVDDTVRHQLWVIDDDRTIAALTRAVDALPALYIADGHHRSAAAARVAKERAKARDGKGSHSYFLAVLFPQQQMTILDYNRVLRDLNGLSPRSEERRVGKECKA